MTKSHDRILGQLEAKLEELHTDVKSIRRDVDSLKKDFIERGVVYKIMGWACGILSIAGVTLLKFLLTTKG